MIYLAEVKTDLIVESSKISVLFKAGELVLMDLGSNNCGAVKIISEDKSVILNPVTAVNRFERIPYCIMDSVANGKRYRLAERRIKNKAKKHCTEVLTEKIKI